MGPNTIKLVMMVLSLIENMADATASIKGVLEKARSEGRDLTNEEVEAVMSETDEKVAALRLALGG